VIYLTFFDRLELSIVFKMFILLAEGFVLNYLCYRYKLIGVSTNLLSPVFVLLSALIVPELSYLHLIYGLIYLGAFFLAYESREHSKRSSSYLIYIGVLIGIAQILSNFSVFLLVPIYVLFIQSGPRRVRDFLLSVLYFFMIIVCYLGVLFIIDLSEKSTELIPVFTFSLEQVLASWSLILIPYVLVLATVHFLMLNTYPFRYPNKSKITNYTMLLQAVLGMLLVSFSGEVSFLIYPLMAIAVILSMAFRYKESSVFVNAAFLSMILLSVSSVYLYSILTL